MRESYVPCFDENLALRFVSGLLDEEACREVEEHAAGCADCRWLLSSAGAAVLEERGGAGEDSLTDAAPSRQRGSARRAIGELLNNTYLLERFLGEGGMGAVYEARHRRLPRRFALKFLSGDPRVERNAIQRLRREAEVTSRLAHPHVVEVFDFNTTPDGVPFLVMELLQGESLGARLDRVGAIEDPSLFVTIVREICSALVAVHGRGVVHRDLKPSNIFLCERDGRADFVKVMDFGISKVLGGDELTATLAVMGSPSYMAPEQATGRSAKVDRRADIFSLGALMFRMLAGQPPFVGDSVPAMVFRLVYEEPTRTPRWDRVPRPVREVILHALGKAPEERPADVGELWNELVEAVHRGGWSAALVESLDSGSLPPAGLIASPAGRLRASGGRESARRWPLLASAALIVAAGAIGLGLWLSGEPAGDPGNAARPPDGPVAAARAPDAALPVEASPSPASVDARSTDRRSSVRSPRVRHGKVTVQTRGADGAYIWADLFLDGRRVGRTPLTVPAVRVGPHEVSVRREGYLAQSRAVRVTVGERTVVVFTMKAR